MLSRQMMGYDKVITNLMITQVHLWTSLKTILETSAHCKQGLPSATRTFRSSVLLTTRCSLALGNAPVTTGCNSALRHRLVLTQAKSGQCLKESEENHLFEIYKRWDNSGSETIDGGLGWTLLWAACQREYCHWTCAEYHWVSAALEKLNSAPAWMKCCTGTLVTKQHEVLEKC